MEMEDSDREDLWEIGDGSKSENTEEENDEYYELSVVEDNINSGSVRRPIPQRKMLVAVQNATE